MSRKAALMMNEEGFATKSNEQAGMTISEPGAVASGQGLQLEKQ